MEKHDNVSEQDVAIVIDKKESIYLKKKKRKCEEAGCK